MNALATLNQMPFSKAEQSDFVNMAVTEIMAGEVNPLTADLHLKAVEEVIGSIRKDVRVKRLVIEEAEKYGKSFDHMGTSITVTKKTVKDFSGIDPVLDDLYAQMDKLKAVIKARESTVESGIDPTTGETFGPVKTQTTEYLSYKFK